MFSFLSKTSKFTHLVFVTKPCVNSSQYENMNVLYYKTKKLTYNMSGCEHEFNLFLGFLCREVTNNNC